MFGPKLIILSIRLCPSPVISYEIAINNAVRNMFLRGDMPEKGAFFLRRGNLPLLAFGRASSDIHHESKHKHIPNTMTKKFLVWSKKYASEAEIPQTISTGELIQGLSVL